MILLLESGDKLSSARVLFDSQREGKVGTTIDTVASVLNVKQHENNVLVIEQEHPQERYYMGGTLETYVMPIEQEHQQGQYYYNNNVSGRRGSDI